MGGREGERDQGGKQELYVGNRWVAYRGHE